MKTKEITFEYIKELFKDAEFENHPIRKDDEVYYVSSDVYLVKYVGEMDYSLKFDFTFIESYSDRDENGLYDSSGEIEVNLKAFYINEDEEVEINEEIKAKVVDMIESKIVEYYR